MLYFISHILGLSHATARLRGCVSDPTALEDLEGLLETGDLLFHRRNPVAHALDLGLALGLQLFDVCLDCTQLLAKVVLILRTMVDLASKSLDLRLLGLL